jgi:hypothetical protein
MVRRLGRLQASMCAAFYGVPTLRIGWKPSLWPPLAPRLNQLLQETADDRIRESPRVQRVLRLANKI